MTAARPIEVDLGRLAEITAEAAPPLTAAAIDQLRRHLAPNRDVAPIQLRAVTPVRVNRQQAA